jgi:hypothetical protein
VLRILAQVPDVSPHPGALPGSDTLSRLVNGLGFWALLACAAGLLIGAAVWALCAHSNNPYGVLSGKRTVVVSSLAAMVVGAGGAIVRFFFQTGQGIR